MGTIASASFRSLLIYTIWTRIHYCFLFSVMAEWQFQCLHFAFCAMRDLTAQTKESLWELSQVLSMPITILHLGIVK